MAPIPTPLMLLALTACGQGHVATLTPHGLLQVDDGPLDLGSVPLDLRAETVLAFGNGGQLPLQVAMALADESAPFQLSQSSLLLSPLSDGSVNLWFEPPESLEAQSTQLILTPDEGDEVWIEVSGVTNPDGDGDGYAHLQLDGDDCDDSRAEVNPGAEESWYDGLDQDCDGFSDFDADGDGWDAEPVGQDCDDTLEAVQPGAEEVWYDGLDQDCDGHSDFDADGDGVDREPEGDDCNDGDPLVRPGVLEVWYDGLDQDCDGLSDFDADGDGAESAVWAGTDCDDGNPGIGPQSSEEDDLEDDDCDGLVDEDFLVAGDVLVTEFMVDPVASYDHHGQYIELFNGTSRVISLAGWQLSTDAAGYWLEGSPVLSPGERLLLCIDSDALLNGGLSCDLSWDGAYELANPDGLLLTAGETLVDEVHWAPLWGLVEGASLSLDPEAHDHLLNDDRSAWCSATTTMTSGDLGTPTTPNDPCP